jgi:hypothetical protein
MVSLLKKTLYVLRQAPRARHTRLKAEFEALGFHVHIGDRSCAFYRGSGMTGASCACVG